MASLKALKLRIGSVKSTQKITKALNMVAASKLRRAQQNAVAARPYSARMTEVVSSLAAKITPGPQSPKLMVDTGEMKAPSYADAQTIAKDIIDRYTTDGIDVVHLAYANFRSTLVQEPTVDQIIPVVPKAAEQEAGKPA